LSCLFFFFHWIPSALAFCVYIIIFFYRKTKTTSKQ
jgi:hypothetical protein